MFNICWNTEKETLHYLDRSDIWAKYYRMHMLTEGVMYPPVVMPQELKTPKSWWLLTMIYSCSQNLSGWLGDSSCLLTLGPRLTEPPGSRALPVAIARKGDVVSHTLALKVSTHKTHVTSTVFICQNKSVTWSHLGLMGKKSAILQYTQK